ncbi:MAG: transposase [Fusobacteriales bacterium]|jgi:transposase-like protein|nr:transposase [Fusobacteriales bacterium]
MEKKVNEGYSVIFKRGIVQLYESGESKSNIVKEHGINESLIDDWVNEYGNITSKNTELNHIANELRKIRIGQEDLTEKKEELKGRIGCLIWGIIFVIFAFIISKFY